MRTPDKILIFAFCRMGDSLAMLPALHLIRNSWRDVKIDILSQDENNGQIIGARQVLANTGLVDAFYAYPITGFWLFRKLALFKLCLSLRKRSYDLGLILILKVE